MRKYQIQNHYKTQSIYQNPTNNLRPYYTPSTPETQQINNTPYYENQMQYINPANNIPPYQPRT